MRQFNLFLIAWLKRISWHAQDTIMDLLYKDTDIQPIQVNIEKLSDLVPLFGPSIFGSKLYGANDKGRRICPSHTAPRQGAEREEEDCKRSRGEDIRDFVDRFQTAYEAVWMVCEMVIPSLIRAFMLFRRAEVDDDIRTTRRHYITRQKHDSRRYFVEDPDHGRDHVKLWRQMRHGTHEETNAL